ncbi:hypothetical protein HY388_00060 [Candidatus Daviesbacteria bacterium]|nr:hypothetical protein [Candidatus Daviesbacteria bacterium]
MPEDFSEYKKLLTEIIQKQIIILGPDVALVKARSVAGLQVGNDGSVTGISGDPKAALQALIDEYVSLSGLIVKKTMEPLLQKYPGLGSVMVAAAGTTAMSTPEAPAIAGQVPAQPPIQPMPTPPNASGAEGGDKQ